VNALETLIAEAVTRRLSGAGRITALTLGAEDADITVELNGQPAPVNFRAEGLRWSVQGDDFRLTFVAARCSLPWLHALLQAWAEKTGRTVTFRDELKFLPLKLRLRRAD
jgi:hypothetical protein